MSIRIFAISMLILGISAFGSLGKEAISWVALSGNKTPSPAEILIIDETSEGMTVEMSFNGFNVEKRTQNNSQFQFISIPNYGWLDEVGMPQLPIVRSLFTIPASGDIAISVESEDYKTLSGYNIYPTGKKVVKNGRNKTVYIDEEFAINKEFYVTNNLYPQEVSKISSSGYLRDQRVIQLEFHPIRYIPSTKELFCYTYIRIHLTYKNYGGFGKTGLLKNLYDSNLGTVSLASSQNSSIKAMSGSVNYPGDLMQVDNADYVIIAPEAFYGNPKLKQLAEWRSQYSGLDVVVVPYDKLYYNFGTGKNSDEMIRDFMQYAYYYWKSPNSPDGHLRYAIIIGDVEYVPTHISDNFSFDDPIATDNWYACVSGDDQIPDVMLGRLPAKNLNELTVMVDKIIQYEQNPIYGDWANNALLMLGTVDYLAEGLIDARDNYLIPSGFNINEISGLDGDNSNDVISELNKGQYILDYAGHGYIDGWEIFTKQDIPKLKNDGMLPAIFSLACSTGHFDHPDRDSIAEVFVKSKNGAIAFFGASRLASASSVGFSLSRAIAGDHIYTLGEIVMSTKLQLLAYSNDLELYNLLGDPALDLGAPRRRPNIPDIIITPVDISFNPETPKQGENITIKTMIGNFGSGNAQNVEVEVRDGGPEGILIDKKTLSNIKPNENISLETNWNIPLGTPIHDIYIKAYQKENTEYWTQNNHAQKQIAVSLELDGYPIKLCSESLSAPVAGDIDSDGDMEILTQSYSYSNSNYPKIFALHQNGQSVSGWPKTITSLPYSYEVRYSNSSGGPVPSIGDIDGDGNAEIVSVFFSQEIYAWKGDGTYMPGWPKKINGYVTTTPVLADMDGDGKLDVVVGTTSGQVYVIRHDGSFLPGFPVSTGKKAHLFISVADIDSDLDMEIIAFDSLIPRNYDPNSKSTIYAWHHDGNMVNGWQVQMQGSYSLLPLVTGDLDGDGKTEIIAIASDSSTAKVYIWNADGTLKSTCEFEANDQLRSATSLADIDEDGDLEIIVGTYDGAIYAWHHDGRKVFGFPVFADDNYGFSTPIIGDIDGDSKSEIATASQIGFISAYKADGTPVSGWQNVTNEHSGLSAPMITDLDGDMKAELIYTSDYGSIHALSLIGRYNDDDQSGWYMFQHDQKHTGSYATKGILPPSPSDIQVTDYPNDKGGAIQISWKSPNDNNVNSFVIYRAEKLDGKYSIIGKVEKTKSSYIDKTTKNGVIYWYIVRASDGNNLSATINPISAYSFNNYAPNPPSYVYAGRTNIDGALNVGWYPVDEGDIGGYKVFYGAKSGNYGIPIDAGMVEHVILVGLENDKEYYVCVTAYDKEGNESLMSAEVIGIPKDEDTDAPIFSSFSPVVAAEGAEFFIRCYITDQSGIYDDNTASEGQGVYLVWGIDSISKDSHIVHMSKLPSGEFITDSRIPGQLLGIQIVYQVYAYDDDYDQNRPDDRTQGISDRQTIKIIPAPKLVYNYPNPAPSEAFPDTTIFRYYAKSDSQIRISIYDISGRLVENLESETTTLGYSETEWNISDLASGIYIYIIEIQPPSEQKMVIKDKLAIIR
jgi:hypothetical protein